MFKIFCEKENNIAYQIYTPAAANQGYGLIEATLSLELNRAGTLRIILPIGHPVYSIFEEIVDECYVVYDEEEIWRGRVTTVSIDFDGSKTVEAEGLLSYFNDSVVKTPEGTYSAEQLLSHYISNHNEQMMKSESNSNWTHPMIKKTFKLDPNVAVDVEGSVTMSNANGYENTVSSIEANLLKNLGGYLKVRRVIETGENNTFTKVNYITYTKDSGETDTSKTQKIQFGKNLLDSTINVDREELFTVLIPTASGSEETEFAPIVNSEGVRKYGYIWRAETFNTRDNDDEETVDPYPEIAQAAERMLANAGLITSVEVAAFDLHNTDELIRKLTLGDSHSIYSPLNGLSGDNSYICSQIEYDLVFPEESTFTFGRKHKSMTEQQIHEANRYVAIEQQINNNIRHLQGEFDSITDYVVKRNAVKNDWTYTLYFSGYMEARYVHEYDNITTTQNTNGYVSQKFDVTIPFDSATENQIPAIEIKATNTSENLNSPILPFKTVYNKVLESGSYVYHISFYLYSSENFAYSVLNEKTVVTIMLNGYFSE